jgi:hypothetical protein
LLTRLEGAGRVVFSKSELEEMRLKEISRKIEKE